MKRILNILILLYFFINHISGINYVWKQTSTDPSVTYYETKENWDPVGVPSLVDNALVNNGAIVSSVQAINVNILEIYNGYFYYTYGQLKASEYIYLSSVLGIIYIMGGGSIITPTLFNKGSIQCIKLSINFYEFDCYFENTEFSLSDVGYITVDPNCSLSLYKDTLYLRNDSFIESGNKSHIAVLGSGIFMYDDSSIFNSGGGSYYFNNTLYAKDRSYIHVKSSTLYIYDYMLFKDNTSLTMEKGSFLHLNKSMVAYNNTFIILESKSYAIVSGYMAFFNESKLWVSESSILWIESELYGDYNSILSVWSNSYIYVKGWAVFGNVINNNAYIIIEDTCFINNILSNENAYFGVNGVFNFNAYIGYFENSIVNSRGDFNIFGTIIATTTKIDVFQGNFTVKDGANLRLYDCNVTVDGFVLISNQSYIDIERTRFFVSEKGEMESKGNIYLNQDSDFKNVGTLNIHSGIYFTNDTSIKSTNVSVSNSGTFNVLEKININVGFNNNGRINLNSKELFIYDLIQNNGSINLSGGTINSDNNFKINGGKVEGSGNINNSLIQTDGIIGSKNKVNNIQVSGNFKSSGSGKVVFVVDSPESFSTLDVLQDIELTSEIEIRINIKFLEQLESGKLNNNLNTANLLSSVFSSSSSSSAESKLNLVNFKSSSNKNNFNSIKFKTYDPEDSNDDNAKDYDGCKVSASKSDRSFSLLLNPSCKNKGSKIAGGVIAAIVISVAFVVIVASVAFHYRERLRLFSKSSKVGSKLKSVRNSIRNSVSLKSVNK